MVGGTPAEAKRHRDGRYGRLENGALHRQLQFVAIPRHPGAADDDCVGTMPSRLRSSAPAKFTGAKPNRYVTSKTAVGALPLDIVAIPRAGRFAQRDHAKPVTERQRREDAAFGATKHRLRRRDTRRIKTRISERGDYEGRGVLGG